MAENSNKPEASKQQPQKFTVMVRHSTFLLKRADVDAASKEEAQDKFIAMAKANHEDRAKKVAKQKGLDAKTIQSTQERIMASYEHAFENKDKVDWSIRPAADVKSDREKLEAQWKNQERRIQQLTGAA